MPRSLATCVALAVGEGLAEAVFLQHVKTLYLPRGCGTTLKIHRGMGKGARFVLKDAISRRDSAGDGYTVAIVMLDTDTDWSDDERQLARTNDIIVIESTPCLEAVLLDILGLSAVRNTEQCKREFERRCGCEAHRAEQVLREQFGREILDAARGRVAALDTLLRALNV